MPEDIGSVNVSIGGDYSDLITAFGEAQKSAEAAGKDIAESFSSAAEGEKTLEDAFQKLIDAGYTVNEAMAQFQGALEKLQQQEDATARSTEEAGSAAANAAGQFVEFGSAADRAAKDAMLFGESAQGIVESQRAAEAELGKAQTALEEIRTAYSLGEASANDLARAESAVKSAFDEANPAMVEAREAAEKTKNETESLIEKLIAFKAALEVTQYLKDFGQQAIEVASEQEKLVISLNALTGSAEETQKKLEEIDRFSFSNALEIDKVEAVTQKMTAFGFSTEETSKLLQAAADSAAATGKSFDSTADKIGNMALSGVAGARQLTALGISAKELGDQMGVSADQVSKAFKAMDESQRIEALTGALDKFQGTAAAVANSTSGQFENLKNDVHNLFETIGGQLLPVVNQMLSVLRDDVLPVIKNVTEWFTNLPEPVKTLAIDAGILTAALIPLTAGIVGLSVACDGLGSIVPIFSGIMKKLGATFVTTAEEAVVAEGAIVGLGEATVTTGAEITAAEGAAGVLGSTLGVLLVGGIAAAVISLIDLKERLDAAHASLQGLSDYEFQAWLKSGIDHLKNASIGVDDLTKLQKNLQLGLDVGAISAGEFARMMDVVAQKLKAVELEDRSEELATFGMHLKLISGDAAKAHDEISILTAILKDAKEKLDGLNNGYELGKVSPENYAKAQKDVTDAQEKLTAAIEDANAKQKLSAIAYAEWTEATNKSLKAITPYLDSIKDLAGAQDILSAKQDVGEQKTALLQKVYAEAGEKLFVLNQRVIDAARALDGTATATENWQHAMFDAVKQADLLERATDALVKAQVAAVSQVNKVSGAIEDLRPKQDAAKDAQAAWASETALLTEKLYEAQQRLLQLNELVRQAKIDDDGSTAAHALWKAAVEAATKAAEDAVKIQKELTEATNKGHEATDNLRTVAVGYGVTLTETVIPAQKKHKDASDANTESHTRQAQVLESRLIPDLKLTKDGVVDLAGALEAAADPTDAETRKLEALAEWASNSAGAIGSLTQDLKSMNDILDLGEKKSKGVSLGSAPDGYYYQTSGNAFTGFKVDLRPIPEGMELGPAGQLIPIPGYDWNKASGGSSSSSSGSSSSTPVASAPSSNTSAFNAAQNQFLLDQLNAAELQFSQAKFAFQSGAGTAEAVATAQQAVQLAQSALDSFTGKGPASSSITSGATDTAAAGGSYPGVVIHQAAGEVLLVALAQAAAGAAGVSDATGVGSATQAANSAALAASSTALTVGVASNTMANVVTALQVLTDIASQTVTQAAQVAARLSMTSITAPGSNYTGNSVAGTVAGTPTTGKNTVGATTSPSYGNALGPVGQLVSGGYNFPVAPSGFEANTFDYNARPSTPTPANAFTPPVEVSIDMSGSTYGAGMNASDIANTVKQAVADSLTRTLRDSGARY